MDHNALRLSVRVYEGRFTVAAKGFGSKKTFVCLCVCVFFSTNLQAGDTSGHQVLGSVDPGSAVWFG